MKKFILFLLSVCVLATALCVSAFAAEAPASDVVVRVSALKKDGTTVVLNDYKSHAEGWSAAMTLADNKTEMKNNDYDRVIVDIYADWTAGKDGEFCDSGKGFNYDAIYFEDGVKMTVNLNGHTIDRNIRDDYQYNGEVMYIDKKADVIINDGTITGGWSCNGAGGIHINDKAYVTLNNVNVVGNRVEDDNGAGIALYDDATLIMNGGSIRDNIADMTIVATIFGRETAYGAGIYAEESTVILENVTIQNNQFLNLLSKGAVIYAEDSDVTLNNCTVVSNGIVDKNAGWEGSMSIIHNEDSAITIKNTKFSNNGCVVSNSSSPCLIYGQGDLTIESCLFSENSAYHMIELYGHKLTVSDTSFVENYANVFYGYGESDAIGTFDRCTFGNNASWNGYYSFKFAFNNSQLIFTDCYFGNSTFNDRSRVKFVDSTQALAGSLIGEGSLTMIVSITALIASVTAIGITLASNKKKKDTPETDDEE